MITLDIILLCILGGFVLFGLWFGLIHMIGGLIGTIGGIIIAGRFYESIAESLTNIIFFGNENAAKIIVFLIIFTIINRLVGLIFSLLNKIFKIISIIPFLGSINRLGGAILGFLEGVLVLGATLYMATKFPLNDVFIGLLADSQVVGYFLFASKIIIPLLPDVLEGIKSVI